MRVPKGKWIVISCLILMVTPAVATVSFSQFTNPYPPMNNSYGPIGFTFAGDGFVGSIYNSGTMSLYKTDLTGATVQVFAPSVSIPGGADVEHFVAASLGQAGFPAYDIYVAASNEIIHINHAGTTSNVFTSGLTGNVRGILFDGVGTFSHNMIVATTAGYIYEVTSTGSFTLLANIGADTEGMDIASPGFGPYAGQLLTGSEGTGLINAISATGVVTPLNTTHPLLGAENVFAVPAHLGTNPLDGYYASSFQYTGGTGGNVLFAAASQFSSYLGGLIVSSETLHTVTAMTWNGSGFTYTQIGQFPANHQPEDGIFLTGLQINPQTGYLEICKTSCLLHPVTGQFTFTATNDTYTSGPISIPVNACSGPIETPAGTVTVNELVRLGIDVTAISAFGYNQYGFRENRLQSDNLPFRTANVTVVPGDSSLETVVTFTNCQAPPGELKVCKVAGPGVTVGTYFTFRALPLSGGPPRIFNVPAGPAPSGYCVQVATYPVGTQVSIVEAPPAGVFVSNVDVSPPDRKGTQTGNGVIVAIDTGITEATFTDASCGRGDNLVQNYSFETGDFTAWSTGGNFASSTVVSGPYYRYSGAEDGQFYAVLGPVGSDGSLSQTFATNPGQPYIVCYWLNAVGDHPSDFSGYWDGSQFVSLTDPTTGNLWQRFVYGTFTGTGSDTLTFSFRDDPGFIALDNVSVRPQ
jgi:hypothetical protein